MLAPSMFPGWTEFLPLWFGMMRLPPISVPELNDIDSALLIEWSQNPRMKDYDYMLRELVRSKPHVLSDEAERILALSGEIGDSYDTIYTMLSDVDLKFAPIKDEKGVEQPMSHGRYRLYLESRQRDIRRQAYESMFKAYMEQINTVTALYGSNVKKDVFYTRARKFPSCRERALFGGDIPVSVYDGLLEAVSEKLPLLHNYVELRKKVLGLSDLKMYDMYVPMFEAFEGEYTFEDACNLVLEALSPLGEKYISVLKKAFNEGWIDVYETKRANPAELIPGEHTARILICCLISRVGWTTLLRWHMKRGIPCIRIFRMRPRAILRPSI